MDTNILEVRNTYQTRGAMKDLEDQIAAFSGITHIEYLRTTLIPRVKAYTDTVDEFVNQLHQLRLIIRKFDENISIKSNKAELILLKE